MSDRFHRAARDGLLDVLKEATRRDCNAHDEDGMTPTLWAAYEGRLEALRLLVGRGGDPDKCDHFGNTALHCAAARGHMSSASFLVNFGVNLWALDNDFHTPKELAALNNKDEILRYLDNAAAEQERASPKDVKQKKEKASKEAEKRIKEFSKIQRKATKRAEKEDKQRQRERERMQEKPSEPEQQKPSSALSAKFMSTISRNSIAGLVHPKSHPGNKEPGMRYSDMVNVGSNQSSAGSFVKRVAGGGVKGRIQQIKRDGGGEFKVRETERDGNRTVRSLTGLRRDSEVMYVPKFDTAGSSEGTENGARRGKIPVEFGGQGGSIDLAEGDIILHEPASLFDRPGLGSLAFRKSISATLSNLRRGEGFDEEEEFTQNYSSRRMQKQQRSHNVNGDETSIGSAGSIANSQDQDVPWDAEDMPSDDEEPDSTPLHILLAATGLIDWIPVFNKERIDLDSLMLLTESDLSEMGIPLGPRKKLMKAMQDRKEALTNPGVVIDSKV